MRYFLVFLNPKQQLLQLLGTGDFADNHHRFAVNDLNSDRARIKPMVPHWNNKNIRKNGNSSKIREKTAGLKKTK